MSIFGSKSSSRSHCGVVDKPLTLNPRVPSSIPSFSCLTDKTQLLPCNHKTFAVGWWDVKHKLTHSTSMVCVYKLGKVCREWEIGRLSLAFADHLCMTEPIFHELDYIFFTGQLLLTRNIDNLR